MATSDLDDCTEITIRFEGEGHEDAAQAILIQFSDGGLNEEFEGRLADQGITVSETDFDLASKTLIVTL
jgi:hypothetical protein